MMRFFALGCVALAACAHASAPPELRRELVRIASADLGRAAPDSERFTQDLLGRLRVHTIRTSQLPQPGDVVYFDDGHSGVIVQVAGSHVDFVYAKGGTVQKGVLSLEHKTLRRDRRGRLVNSYVRPRKPDDPPGTRYLAGELARSFCEVEPD